MTGDPVNVSPDTRFDEASDDQFREFWEGQGWGVEECDTYFFAYKNCALDRASVNISGCWREVAYFGLGDGDTSEVINFPRPIATFGEALRLANNLAQAELFGGWAE